MEEVKDIQEVHEEDQVQGRHEEVTKNENVKGIKEEKEVMGNVDQVEITEPLKDEYEEASGEQKDVTEKPAEFKVTEIIKDEKEEMKEEQDDMVEKRKIMQLATMEAAQHMITSETKTEESNTLVEENEEAMLLEDGMLLMYVEKQSRTDRKTELAEIQLTPIAEISASDADNWTPTPRQVDKISERSQKSRVEDIDVATSTSQSMVKSDEVGMEETFEECTSRINMVDKLVQAANNLENEVRNKENIKIPAIDLLLRIQAALDECQVFPENNTVDILEIINRIPDKSALAWQERLNGEMIGSHQAKALIDPYRKKAGQRNRKRNNKEKMPT